MSPVEKLISDAAKANMSIKWEEPYKVEIRRRGSDRPVIIYLKGLDAFDWAFQVPAPKGPSPKTIRTIQGVRTALALTPKNDDGYAERMQGVQ